MLRLVFRDLGCKKLNRAIVRYILILILIHFRFDELELGAFPPIRLNFLGSGAVLEESFHMNLDRKTYLSDSSEPDFSSPFHPPRTHYQPFQSALLCRYRSSQVCRFARGSSSHISYDLRVRSGDRFPRRGI